MSARPRRSAEFVEPDPRFQNFLTDRADLRRAADSWPTSERTPHPVAEMLRVSRELFVHSYFVYEFGAVAVVWSVLALEGALRDRLGEAAGKWDGLSTLIDRTREYGWISDEEQESLKAGALFRNRLVHAGEQTYLPPGTTEPMLHASHAAISAVYERAAALAERRTVAAAEFPSAPGVYVVYEPQSTDADALLYVGVAAVQSIAKRWQGQHLQNRSGGSALRRSLGPHLGLVDKKLTAKAGRYYPVEVEEEITDYLESCSIVFFPATTADEADELEVELRKRLRPKLNISRARRRRRRAIFDSLTAFSPPGPVAPQPCRRRPIDPTSCPPMDLLKRISPARYDAEAVAETATRFQGLSQEEQDEYLGLWHYAGLDEASHPFTSLLRESHNNTCVVRDLDGSLQLLWEDEPRSGRWLVSPLYQENLIGDDEIADLLDADPDWLASCELELSHDELSRLLASLPGAPGPAMRF